MVCIKCKEEKSIEEFTRNKGMKDGIMKICRVCWRNYINSYRQKHLEYIRQYRKNYYENNKMKFLKERNKICVWTEADNQYSLSCNDSIVINVGVIPNIKFCFNCGKNVQIKKKVSICNTEKFVEI